MKTITRSAIVGITLAAVTVGPAGIAGAHAKGGSAKSGNISISNATVRVVPEGTANTAAYMTIRSKGTADTLKRASVPASFATMTQLHRSIMTDGKMAMIEQKKGIGIARNGVQQLKMGGFHVMIMGLKAGVTAGQKVPITLTFKKAGVVTVTAVATEM